MVDDHLQGITDVVRGIDLMSSTPRQIWLQQLLGYDTPTYCHIPVAVNDRRQKLSKSHGAQPVPLEQPAEILALSLEALRQNPPSGLANSGVEAVWAWAIGHWNIRALEGMKSIDARGVEWA